MIKSEIICRPITASDEKEIILARNEIFKKNDDWNFFRYFYSSPDKKNLNGLVLTTKNNDLVGAVFFVLLKCFYLNKEIPLYLICDEFIKLAWQKHGYGVFLNKEIYNFVSKNSVGFGLASHKYTGPGRLFKVNAYLKKIGLSSRIFPYKNKFGNAKIESLSSFNDLSDDIFLKLKGPAASIKIIKDKKYLDWRYLNLPDNPYQAYTIKINSKIISYFILESKNKTAYIADLAYSNSDDLEKLINITTHWCQKTGYRQVAFILINEFIEKKLIALGYQLQPTDQWLVWMTATNDLSKKSDWHIIYGDLL